MAETDASPRNFVGEGPKRTREEAAEALRTFYLRSHRVMDRIMTREGVSFARGRVLLRILHEGTLRSVDLASFLNCAPRTITEAIDGLEQDGLVTRSADPKDRRVKNITLTSAGTAAAKVADGARGRLVDAVFGGLSEDENRALLMLLGKLSDRLDAF